MASRPLVVRRPELEDVPSIRAAHRATVATDRFAFAFDIDDLDDEGWLEKVADEERGVDLPPNLVRASFLIGVVGRDVVGRVSVRHELNDALAWYGGHIGYAVVPSARGRGYATALARAGLDLLAAEGVDTALLTCEANNEASVAVIERVGGVRRDEIELEDGTRALRFDVATS